MYIPGKVKKEEELKNLFETDFEKAENVSVSM